MVDAQAHLDLAHDYAEMGLATDAVRSAAIALSVEAPAEIAQRAFALISGDDARDTLAHALRVMRSSS